ncbi:MAG TPA: carboxypeptidase-like regulatory domain-containing protein [Gemmatimonadaceae bacterium]|nr:carboxypeptidase-like regulatory domain-containing protein [Gemmatimonadaceae bacterium]
MPVSRTRASFLRGGACVASCVAAIIAALCAVAPTSLSAQTDRGTARIDGSVNASIQTSILLVDETGSLVAGTMTDENGGYALRAPRRGSYRVRARRIGFAPVFSRPLAVAAGATVNFDPSMRLLPATLAEVNVQETERCVIAPEAGAAALALWEAVQNALSGAAASSISGTHSFMLTRFQRELHPQTGKVLTKSSWKVLVSGSETYRSLPADSLAAAGYLEHAAHDTVYYTAPDARTLISDAFARTHCLHPVAGSTGSGSVGLAFEPIDIGGRTDVAGTLWLERSTGKLQYLQFQYVDSSTRSGDSTDTIPRATGTIHYRELEDGSWIIDNWTITVPVIAYYAQSPRQRGSGDNTDSTKMQPRPYVERLHEFGGNVTEVIMPRSNSRNP